MSNTELLEQYRTNRKITDPKFLKQFSNPILFPLYSLQVIPMVFLSGCRIKQIDSECCQITVPYRWLNQNPFNSTYFAVLSMAAETSAGIMAVFMTRDSKPSVSTLVTQLEADFVKKATGLTTFTFSEGKQMNEVIEKTILRGEPQIFSATSIGTSQTGEVVARFRIEFSFKMRAQK